MGKHGVGDLVNNGERVIILCEENNLIIGGTLFMHRNIHKLNWTSPDRRTQSQINHIIINRKWRDSPQDVQVMRNADISSDHNLLVAKITLKLRNAKIGMARNQQQDISKLKDTLIKDNFSITLKNHFSILQDETVLTIDDFNTAMMESAKETIRYTKTYKTEWISPDTWRTIEESRQLKKKVLDSKSPSLKERAVTQNREKDKQVKTSARRDNRQYVERLATEVEAAAVRRDTMTVCQITRKLRGDRGQNQDLNVKAKDRSIITEEKAKLERWREHIQ